MEAVNAYYNGYAFVPTKSVQVKKNQKAIITILDETRDAVSFERARSASGQMYGMFEGSDLSSKEFKARKAYEKALER
jgi:hypothetical protein